MCSEAAKMAVDSLGLSLTTIQVDCLAAAIDALSTDTALLILDLGLPDSQGAASLATIVERHPALSVIVVSASDSARMQRTVKMIGAKGFVSKSAPFPVHVRAFQAVLNGSEWFADLGEDADDPELERNLAAMNSLTPAQRRVLDAMAGGRLNKQIAHDLQLSEITIKAHVKAILRKLEVSNRTQAILLVKSILSEPT
jgi:DNA-binding NarL/FixJ family response regulator